MKLKYIFSAIAMMFLLNACNDNGAIEATESKKRCDVSTLTLEQVTNLLYGKNLNDIQFIDIRDAHSYSVSHLPGAVNIPLPTFFDDKYFSRINKDKILMIYGDDSSLPRLISLMSAHYKLANMYVIMGGYDFLKDKIIDNFGIYSGLYNDEEALYDYAKKLAEVSARAGAGAAKPVAVKKAPVPVVKRKKKEVSGGCG